MSTEGTAGAAYGRPRYRHRLKVWAAAMAVFAVGSGAAVPLTAGTAAAAPSAGAAVTDASGHGHPGSPRGDRAGGGNPGAKGQGWGPDGRAEVHLLGTVQQATNDALVLTSTASTGPDHLTGPVTVAVDAATRYREPGIRDGGLAAIVQGDVVAVRAKRYGSSGLQALEVTLPLVRVTGFVATSGDAGFTLTGTGTTLDRAWGGTVVTVDVSASTRYLGTGGDHASAPKSAPSPLTPGWRVAVLGTQNGPATLNGLTVLVLPARHRSEGGDGTHGNGHGNQGHGGHGRGDVGRHGGHAHPSRDRSGGTSH